MFKILFQNSELTAVLVDDMLRDWFNYEMKIGYGPPCTLTIVDVVGNPPFSLNFLTSNILNSIFQDFGRPYLLPYTAALAEPHVQVLFGSMTEALAACIAFGDWYELSTKVDTFFYRVRINPSDKEELLIRHSGGTPEEAFKLDYFLSVRNAIKKTSKAIVCSTKQNKIPITKISSKNKELQKTDKHKYAPLISIEQQITLLNQMGYSANILCVPMIPPLSGLTATNQQVKADSSMAILNVQQTSQTVVTKNDYAADNPPKVQYQKSDTNFECIDCKQLKKFNRPQEKVPKDIINTASKDGKVVPPKQIYHAPRPRKNFHKGTRIFERRT